MQLSWADDNGYQHNVEHIVMVMQKNQLDKNEDRERELANYPNYIMAHWDLPNKFN